MPAYKRNILHTIHLTFDQLFCYSKWVMQGNTTYAVIETGGKQYRVTTGRQIQVDRLDVPAGNTVEFSNVLVVTDGGNTIIGNPTVDGAKVIATCLGEEKDDKNNDSNNADSRYTHLSTTFLPSLMTVMRRTRQTAAAANARPYTNG